MTSRREFLASLGAAAFVAPDAERLLWRRGARTISIPAPRVMEYLDVRVLRAYDPVSHLFVTRTDVTYRIVPLPTVYLDSEDVTTIPLFTAPLEATKRAYNESLAAWVERVRRGGRVRVLG